MQGGKLASTIMFSLALATITSLATFIMAGTHATWMDTGTADWQSQLENPQESFTPEVRTRLSKQALAQLRKSPVVRDQRLRVLSIKSLPGEKDEFQKSLASVVVFNYSTGNATRLVMYQSNGLVLRQERLRGRPQPSEEELQEARRIIRADPEQARLLAAGGVLEGGFVVDAPSGQSLRHRFIQFQILTSDRLGLQRLVVVNLTTGGIAESKQQPLK